MMLLQLPAWLDAWGVPVDLEPGWETRGVPFGSAPLVVLGHHTATSAAAKGDLPTRLILRDGRTDLAGPLCQVAGTRSGRARVIAAGKANHAGAGRWQGLPGGRAYDVRVSSLTVGIEMEHPGKGPWPAEQLRAFDLIACALLWGLGQTAEALCHHKEWALPAGRKVDAGGVSAPDQRLRIGRLLAAGPPGRVTTPPAAPRPRPPAHLGDDMAHLITHDGSTIYATNGLARRWVKSRAELNELVAAGALESDKATRVAPATLDALVLVGNESPGRA